MNCYTNLYQVTDYNAVHVEYEISSTIKTNNSIVRDNKENTIPKSKYLLTKQNKPVH